MIRVWLTVPLEAVDIDSRRGREPPAPPREAISEGPAPRGKVGDHPSCRDLHQATAKHPADAKIDKLGSRRIIRSSRGA
jgi:hypothetical protein